MQAQNNNGYQKSLYIFLSSILGVLLFLILHRLAIFVFLVLQTTGSPGLVMHMPYLQFLAWDYFTLLLTLILGAWYGIWVGTYWYEKVYDEGSHRGFVAHVSERYWPKAEVPENIKQKITEVEKILSDELSSPKVITMAVSAEVTPKIKKRPAIKIKKRVVKKKAVKI